MGWILSIIACLVGVSFLIGCLIWMLGHRFLDEFTRPGMAVEPGTPQWGGWIFPDEVDEPPRERQRAVTFHTADGVHLRGEFWAQPRSAPTIILSHGFHLPSRHFRSVAALEYSYGANILLFDYRGHGESMLKPTTCGNAEVNDLLAALNLATSQAETASGQIYIHGFSMGAAVALLLPPHPAVAGVIADSAYARLDDMIRVLILQILDQQTSGWRGPARVVRPFLPLLTFLMLLGGRLLFRARYHHSLVARPDRAIANHTARKMTCTSQTSLPPLLLIHAENDPFITLHHAHRLVAIADAAGRAIQAYYTPCGIHCGSYGYDPERYMALLQQFVALEPHLNDGFSEGEAPSMESSMIHSSSLED